VAIGRDGSFPGEPVVFRGRERRSDKMYTFQVRHAPKRGEAKNRIHDMAVCLYKTAQDFNRHPILLGDLKKSVHFAHAISMVISGVFS